MKIVPDLFSQVFVKHAASLALLELREALQVINVLKVPTGDGGFSRLLLDGLGLLFLDRLDNNF